MATRGSIKIEFNQKPLSDFWIGLRSEYLVLANRVIKTLMPFATMYLCESGLSPFTTMKLNTGTEPGVENDFKTETL